MLTFIQINKQTFFYAMFYTLGKMSLFPQEVVVVYSGDFKCSKQINHLAFCN